MNIKTYGIHDQFALKPQNKESWTLLENNGITLAIDAPIHIMKSLHQDVSIASRSVMTKVDYLLITHTDNDHIGWLANLLWWKVFGEKQKLNLITHKNIASDLWEILKRNGFWYDRTSQEEKHLEMQDYIHVLPLWYDEHLEIEDFGRIETFHRATHHQHGMDVLAFRVWDENEKNILNFSSDSRYDDELISFLLQKEWKVIHEVGSYTPSSHSHTDVRELLENIPVCEHSRIFLNHIPEIREEEILRNIQKFKSKIQFATFIS